MSSVWRDTLDNNHEMDDGYSERRIFLLLSPSGKYVNEFCRYCRKTIFLHHKEQRKKSISSSCCCHLIISVSSGFPVPSKPGAAAVAANLSVQRLPTFDVAAAAAASKTDDEADDDDKKQNENPSVVTGCE